jgi:hypothetical protein
MQAAHPDWQPVMLGKATKRAVQCLVRELAAVHAIRTGSRGNTVSLHTISLDPCVTRVHVVPVSCR